MIKEPIIFLDFNGVLWQKGHAVSFPYAPEYLKQLVKSFNAKIVVTSNMRISHDVEELQKGHAVSFPYAPEYLKQLVKSFNAKIVVTSNMRISHDVEELQKVLKRMAGKRVGKAVIGKLYDSSLVERGAAITEWRAANEHQGGYVVIDDEPVTGHDGYVVQTHPEMGLCFQAANDAAHILLEQQ